MAASWRSVELAAATGVDAWSTGDIVDIAVVDPRDSPTVFAVTAGGRLLVAHRLPPRTVTVELLGSEPRTVELPADDTRWSTVDAWGPIPDDGVRLRPGIVAVAVGAMAVCIAPDSLGRLWEISVSGARSTSGVTVSWQQVRLDSPVAGPVRAFTLGSVVMLAHRAADGRVRIARRVPFSTGGSQMARWDPLVVPDHLLNGVTCDGRLAAAASAEPGARTRHGTVAIGTAGNGIIALHAISHPLSGVGWSTTDIVTDSALAAAGLPPPSGTFDVLGSEGLTLLHYEADDGTLQQLVWEQSVGWSPTVAPSDPAVAAAPAVEGHVRSAVMVGGRPAVWWDPDGDASVAALIGSATGWVSSEPGDDVGLRGADVTALALVDEHLAAAVSIGSPGRAHWVYRHVPDADRRRGGGVLGAVGRVFRRVVDALLQPAEWLGDALIGLVNAVIDVVTTAVNALASALEGLLRAVGLTWLAAIVGGVLRFVTTVVKGAGDLVSEVVKGTLDIGRGVATFSPSHVYEGSKRILEIVVSVVVLVAYALVRVLAQVFFGWLFGLLDGPSLFPRPLTTEEYERLRPVYGESLRYSDIRIVDAQLGGAHVTLGNEIWILSSDDGVLVHEAMHVWQYQNVGSSYVLRNLGDQSENSSGDDGYDWERIYAPGTPWGDMGYESQAEFFYDVWHDGTTFDAGGVPTTGSGAYFANDPTVVIRRFVAVTGDDWTAVADRAVQHVRSA